MISDVQDILEVSQDSDTTVTKERLMHGDQKKKKQKKPDEAQTKRPQGMNREVYNLLRKDCDVGPLIPTMSSSSKMGGYKHMKARLGLRRVRPWRWMPFTNAARKDGLQLNHWRRAEDEGKEYQFVRFNKVLDIASYTAEEYNKLLPDRNWSKDETDHLVELAARYDLRWPVMVDRWDSSRFSTKRTVEDLKERYYFLCNQLTVAKTPPGEAPKLIYFDVDNERRRKEQLTKLWNRTPEQVKEEEDLLREMRLIEARKLERERKAQDLQKLISAAEMAPPTPTTTSQPLSAPKKKLPRQASVTATLNDAANVEAISGLKFQEFKSAGVYLRTQKTKLPPTVSQKKVKAIEQSLEKLGIEPHPMGSDEVVNQFNDLRSDIVLLYDLKAALGEYEFQLETLKHEYNALTGKELVIPSRLHVNSEEGTGESSITSPFKRRIADSIDIGSGLVPPRKRKAPIEPSPLMKKLRKS